MVKLSSVLILLVFVMLAAVAYGAPAPQGAPPSAPAKAPAPLAAAPAAASLSPAVKPAPTPPPPQVRIEARILEWQVSDSLDFDFAVQYHADPGSGNILGNADLTLPADPALSSAARLFLGNLDAGNGSFDAVIEALKGVGKVRILSEPSIILTALQVDPTRAPLPPPGVISTVPSTAPSKSGNDPAWAAGSARLTNATQVPYAITQYVGLNAAEVTLYRDVGVTLDVVAQNVKDNLVFLDTRASVSDVSGFISIAVDRDGNPQTVPVIDSRMIQNRLVIPDRTIFIAGLMKTTREVERKSGIPWLSELPGLRWLLASHRTQTVESELVFLLRPEIMSPYRAAGAGLAQEGLR